MLHVRKGDIVQVMCGNHRGKTGRVLGVFPQRRKVLVEGINYVFKHVRPSQRNPQGGRVQREAPIDISNVQVICQNRNCKRFQKGVRTRATQTPTGQKVRACVKCGQVITTGE